jgi:hypothetical protein
MSATEYVNCGPSDLLVRPGDVRNGYYLTFEWSYAAMLNGFALWLPETFAQRMQQVTDNLQLWTNDALVPVPPYPVAPNSLLVDVGTAVTLAVVTLGNASQLQIAAAVQLITGKVPLVITRVERVAMDPATGKIPGIEQPDRTTAMDATNTAAQAAAPTLGQSLTADLDKLTGLLKQYAAFALLAVVVLVVGWYVLTTRRS